MTTMNVQELHRWREEGRDFVLVDTLPPSAFEKAHLPGAINIMSDEILARAPDELPDKTRDVVVYCASARCKRAGLSAERLERLGYRNVYHFVGGKRDWREAGLPLEGSDRDSVTDSGADNGA